MESYRFEEPHTLHKIVIPWVFVKASLSIPKRGAPPAVLDINLFWVPVGDLQSERLSTIARVGRG